MRDVPGRLLDSQHVSFDVSSDDPEWIVSYSEVSHPRSITSTKITSRSSGERQGLQDDFVSEPFEPPHQGALD